MCVCVLGVAENVVGMIVLILLADILLFQRLVSQCQVAFKSLVYCHVAEVSL